MTVLVHKLYQILANSYAYQLLCQNFHWNVTGPHFISLHAFFEEAYKEANDSIDVIAERIRALEKYTPASLKDYLELSQLKEVRDTLSPTKMLEHLLQSNATMCIALKEGISLAEKNEDPSTEDMFIQFLRVYEKQAWMLRSLLNV